MSGDLGTYSFASGMLMGLASSLHCAGMCGGIAATLCFAFDPSTRQGSRLRVLMTAQAGRVATYMLLGAAAGGFGTLVYGALPAGQLHFALRAVAAISLGWIGLATLGLVPATATFDRLIGPLTLRLRPVNAGAHAPLILAPMLAGVGWGLMPCAMVWGALFYAMAAGSSLGGAATMLGFGLGTIPAVTVAALGIGRLRDLARAPQLRVAVGLGLMSIAVLTLIVPMRALAAVCFTHSS